jgi:CheY-like chemotaxis protein
MPLPKKLLLVDDDEDDREIFLSVVQTIAPAVECRMATNGQDALNKLNQHHSDLPDLIFLDLNMPLMDGRQFLREIKKHNALKEIPVIVLSTSSDKETISLSRSLGASDFITKPDKYSGWEQTLKTHLAGRDA